MINGDLINMIFGMKVRKARTEMKMNLSSFAKACELSPSYLTEIEKGRKYPRQNKILRISAVTGIAYDDLVSIKLDPSLRYLESIMRSPLFTQFPFEEFGLDKVDVFEMLTKEPEKSGVLLRALIGIGRRYDMRDEHFLRAALRSYQEMNDNYFEEIEEAAEAFAAEYNLTYPLTSGQLRPILETTYNQTIDNKTISEKEALRYYRTIAVNSTTPRLLINSALGQKQITSSIARELGFHVLNLKARSYTSPPNVSESFGQVLNDFKASYFAGALMMPKQAIIADITHFFEQKTWQPDLLIAMLKRYDVTPEILSYRLSELIPFHFGIDMHFLRINEKDKRYRLYKHLNLNQLPLPQGMGLHEHHCRRWLTVRLIKELREGMYTHPAENLHTGIQISEFLHSGQQFLCFGFSAPLSLHDGMNTSVTLGFAVTPELKKVMTFAKDSTIMFNMIHDTCERCPLVGEQCTVRAAPPHVLNEQKASSERKEVLQSVMAGFKA